MEKIWVSQGFNCVIWDLGEFINLYCDFIQAAFGCCLECLLRKVFVNGSFFLDYSLNVLVCLGCKGYFCDKYFDFENLICFICAEGKFFMLRRVVIYSRESRFIIKNNWDFVDEVDIVKKIEEIGVGYQLQ